MNSRGRRSRITRSGDLRLPTITDYFHTRHACGHSVYWSDGLMGMTLAPYPCPYCGGETGVEKPPQDAMLDVGEGIRCFMHLNSDGSVPRVPGERPGREIGIHHMTGNVCCE